MFSGISLTGSYRSCKRKAVDHVMFYPSFARNYILTRFAGSRHDGFIVLCATQIVKGYQGSKRGKGERGGRALTLFVLVLGKRDSRS